MVRLAILAILGAALVAESTCQYKIIRPTYRPPLRRTGPVIRTVRDVDTSEFYEPPAVFVYDADTQTYEQAKEAEDQMKALQEEFQLPNNQDSTFNTDDITTDPAEPNRRIARSLDSPSAKRYGSYSPKRGSKAHRVARSPRDLEFFDAREPLSLDEGKTSDPYIQGQFDDVRMDPNLRYARDLKLPYGVPKGPAKLPPFFPIPQPQPQPRIPIYARNTREVHIPGVKKPTYRDIVIPNWNPNVKTNPWSRIGGRH